MLRVVGQRWVASDLQKKHRSANTWALVQRHFLSMTASILSWKPLGSRTLNHPDFGGHPGIWTSSPSQVNARLTLNSSYCLREEGKQCIPGALICRWNTGWPHVLIWPHHSRFQVYTVWEDSLLIRVSLILYLTECTCCFSHQDVKSNFPPWAGLSDFLDQQNVMRVIFWVSRG